MLTQKRLKELLIYDESTGVFTRAITTSSKAISGDVAGFVNGYGYLAVRLDGTLYLNHRLAWMYVNGSFPNGVIDHVNCDRKDNRISNLRVASISENGWNRGMQSTNTSGVKGVSWCKRSNRWRARVMKDGKSVGVGYFSSLEKAESAVKEARIMLHREFSNSGDAAQ